MKKRFGSFVVASLLLFVIVFSAYGEGRQEESARTDDFMTITWLDRSEMEDLWFTEHLEEKFNVDIQFNGIHPNEGERVQVMLTAASLPTWGCCGISMDRRYSSTRMRSFGLFPTHTCDNMHRTSPRSTTSFHWVG